MSDPAASEALAKVGFDFVVVDMQHSALTRREMQDHVRSISIRDVLPYVRVLGNNRADICSALDAGARGIIVPNVDLASTARRAVDYMGKDRSTGLWRSRSYGMTGESHIPELIVQIEHYSGVSNIEKILAVEGVHGFLIGPFDLSASMGITGDFSHPNYKEAIETIRKAAEGYTGRVGIHIPIPQDILKAASNDGLSYNFLAVGMDTTWMWDNARTYLQELRTL
jgi:2-dehydro-3-deoxyglucarate aldolase